MTRRPATLTAAFVRTVSKPGVYGDGRGSRGLSLRVHLMKSGRLSRTWRQRLRVAGRLTTTELGRFPEGSLAEARLAAPRGMALDVQAVRHADPGDLALGCLNRVGRAGGVGCACTHPVLEDHPAPQQWAAPHE